MRTGLPWSRAMWQIVANCSSRRAPLPTLPGLIRYLSSACGAVGELRQQDVPVVVEVADQRRRRTPASSIRLLISGHGRAASGTLTVTRTISEPACGELDALRGRRGDVGRVGVRHRLDDDRRAAADLDGADRGRRRCDGERANPCDRKIYQRTARRAAIRDIFALQVPANKGGTVRRNVAAMLALAAVLGGSARAQEKPPEKPPEKGAEPAKKEPPKAEQSVTQHSAVIGGVPVAYTATAGTLIVRNDKDEPWASIGYIAYVRKDAGAGTRRPVTFSLQRRPGLLLHLAPHGRDGPPARRDDRRGRDASAAVPGRGQRVQPARQDGHRPDRSGRHGLEPRRRQREGQGLLGRRSGHRIGRALHPAVDHRQRPVELAEVPARRELRHDALGRRGRLAAVACRHGLQRRRPRLRRDRYRGDLPDAGRRPRLPALPADLRGDGGVPQGPAEPAARTSIRG